ncbi:MAG: hypothetical protein ABIQ09_03910 [Jatrophihabitantaceae bacterium]
MQTRLCGNGQARARRPPPRLPMRTAIEPAGNVAPVRVRASHGE